MISDFYVYIIFRSDGHPCYVGKGRGRRWLKHEWRSTNPHLANIIRLAGGTLPKVKVRENLTEVEAFETEVALITAIGREDNGGPLVNMSDGGEGPTGYKFSPELVEQIRIKNKGRQPWNLGKSFDEETKKKMSAAKLGRPLSEEHKMAIAKANRGLMRTAATCAKLGNGRRGICASEALKEKLRASNRSNDPLVRARISLMTRRAMTFRRQLLLNLSA